ncbi:MAG: propionyl-CoA synthetase, partial [Gammaproteobacteria bacterium]|nr:propionyl-CoA synthetase [Gammaproteobacteria bacterium]
KTICKIADGQPYNVPATIEDATTLDEMEIALSTLGYAQTPKA